MDDGDRVYPEWADIVAKMQIHWWEWVVLFFIRGHWSHGLYVKWWNGKLYVLKQRKLFT